ncbi:MAG: nucleotidyltransferase domain-containing protein [Chloroflexota bacterium]|nr:nucleotidyltransferase domain-containing protein [Chloroflexota bacterium]
MESTDTCPTGTQTENRDGSSPTLAQLRARRQEILRIADARGAHDVRVFGSVGRGDATPTSDIDLLVDFDPGRNVLDLSELILDLQDLLDCRVDVMEIRSPSPMAEKILREAVPL